jgi:hypothetical protein
MTYPKLSSDSDDQRGGVIVIRGALEIVKEGELVLAEGAGMIFSSVLFSLEALIVNARDRSKAKEARNERDTGCKISSIAKSTLISSRPLELRLHE